MTTTDLLTRSLLGRARDAVVPGSATPDTATIVDPSHVRTVASAAYVTTTTRILATDVATNPWLGGFGFGGGMDTCPTIDGSSKRIHPGFLEGVT